MKDTFESLENEAVAFRDERDWEQFHNPKDLALGLQVEAAELAELFLWRDAAACRALLEDEELRSKLEAEIADVQIFLFYLARAADLSIPDAVRRKLRSNAEKYPVERATGSAAKYTELAEQRSTVEQEGQALVVGVDSCREGWVGVALVGGKFEEVRVFPSIERLSRTWAEAEVFAVDMPLSFPVSYPRPTETAVRGFLNRKSSLFPTMLREVLAQPTYEEALTKARTLVGVGLSKQSYAMRQKIFELESYLEGTRDGRFFEIHPELSYQVLSSKVGLVVNESKKTQAGAQQRLRALRRAGLAMPAQVPQSVTGAGTDDVLDAAAAAWSAHRIHLQTARSFPEELSEVRERCPNQNEGVIWA